MNKTSIFITLAGIFALGLLAGCQEARPLVDDPTISLNYLKEPSEDNLTALSKAYAQSINRARKDAVKRPGLCSDYAVTLALLGNQAEANQWFNREMADFPASRDYVQQLKAIYCPAYAGDQSVATEADDTPLVPAPSGADAAVQQVIDQQQSTLSGQPQPEPKKAPAKTKSKKKPSKKPRKR